MDSPSFTVLMAIAGLVAGLVLGWLVARGRTAARVLQARGDAQAELAQARGRIRQLEEECQAAARQHDDLKRQTARPRSVLDTTARDQALLAERTAQATALQADLAALQADAAQARSEARAEQARAREYVRSLEKNQHLAAANAQARVLALEQENAALRRSTPAQATQLPVLEEQVAALQTLEKSIKKEFQLLAELQRAVTLTSATRHEFTDSPESRTSVPATA